MNTEKHMKARKRRLAYIVEKYGAKSKEMRFMGVALSDLTREELLAVLVQTSENYTNTLNMAGGE